MRELLYVLEWLDMRNPLLLIFRYGGFLLFAFLEILCFILIVQFNQDQQAIFNNTWANGTAWMDRTYVGAVDYLRLDRRNDSLAVVNARLYEELLAHKRVLEEMEQDSLYPFYLDSLFADTVCELIPAAVIRNSISSHHNYIILDKGSQDSVDVNMGVVLDNGIVGVVLSVGKGYALVMSVLHLQAKPSASIKGTNYFGSLTWNGGNPRELLLENIPKHANPEEGDTIVTSGYSLIFPKGIPIGTIQSFQEGDGGSDTYQISVKLFADLSNLDRVFVVKNKDREELEDLAQKIQDE